MRTICSTCCGRGVIQNPTPGTSVAAIFCQSCGGSGWVGLTVPPTNEFACHFARFMSSGIDASLDAARQKEEG